MARCAVATAAAAAATCSSSADGMKTMGATTTTTDATNESGGGGAAPTHDAEASGEPGARLISPLQHSRIGRDTQRYDGARRLLACAVILRHQEGTHHEREVLLISSSKRPNEWILPKGGWESDETLAQCALREAEEEAGVAGEIVRPLGELDFATTQGRPCRFSGFELACTQQFDHWAEQSRRRRWVPVSEALALLSQRPELLVMLTRADSQ